MRPVGVTLIGIYQILRGILSMLFALSILLFSGLATKLASIAAEGTAIERRLSGAGHLLSVSILVFGLIHLLTGIGLFKMQNWARLLTVLLSAIGLVLLLPVVIVAQGIPLVLALINAVCIFYLATPGVRRMFQRKGSAAPAAA